MRWNNRYNRFGGDSNYSSGDGGTIRLELRPDTGLGHPPYALGAGSERLAPLLPGDSNLLGRTPDRASAVSLGVHPTLQLTSPVPVTAGRLYWCVWHQLASSGWVSVNSAHIKGWAAGTRESAGGPYFGQSWHIARSGTNKHFPTPGWLYEDGTFPEELRHLVKLQLLYRLPDGREVWSGYGSVFAIGSEGPGYGSQRAFSDRTPIRMSFTPRRPTFTTSTLWWRGYRRLSEPTAPGDMTVRLYRGTTLLGSWRSPPTRWVKSIVANKNPAPPPIPFVDIGLGQSVEIRQGQLHHLVFGAASGEYLTHAQQVAAEFTCRNTFRDGYAQYSTNGGATWSNGWHFGSSTNRKDFVLPFMFEADR